MNKLVWQISAAWGVLSWFLLMTYLVWTGIRGHLRAHRFAAEHRQDLEVSRYGFVARSLGWWLVSFTTTTLSIWLIFW